jgi:hypothetical protein
LLQRVVDKLESNIAALEAKLQHERQKFVAYDGDLKELERRCADPCGAWCFGRRCTPTAADSAPSSSGRGRWPSDARQLGAVAPRCPFARQGVPGLLARDAGGFGTGVPASGRGSHITGTERIQSVLFGTQNRRFGRYLASTNRVSVSASGRPRWVARKEPGWQAGRQTDGRTDAAFRASLCCAVPIAPRRLKASASDRDAGQRQLEVSSATFREFERRDIKYREDLKHLKAKIKKLGDKLAKDEAKAQVRRARGAATREMRVMLMAAK